MLLIATSTADWKIRRHKASSENELAYGEQNKALSPNETIQAASRYHQPLLFHFSERSELHFQEAVRPIFSAGAEALTPKAAREKR